MGLIVRLDDWTIDRYDAFLGRAQEERGHSLPRLMMAHRAISIASVAGYLALRLTVPLGPKVSSWALFVLVAVWALVVLVQADMWRRDRRLALKFESGAISYESMASHMGVMAAMRRHELRFSRVGDALFAMLSLLPVPFYLYYGLEVRTTLALGVVFLSLLACGYAGCALPRRPNLRREVPDAVPSVA